MAKHHQFALLALAYLIETVLQGLIADWLYLQSINFQEPHKTSQNLEPDGKAICVKADRKG